MGCDHSDSKYAARLAGLPSNSRLRTSDGSSAFFTAAMWAASNSSSRQRAQNVVNALVENHGIARSRLAVEGFGETRRVAYNTSLEGQQENRRVNIIFTYPK